MDQSAKEFMQGVMGRVKRDVSPKAPDKPQKTRKIKVKSHTRTILCKK